MKHTGVVMCEELQPRAERGRDLTGAPSYPSGTTPRAGILMGPGQYALSIASSGTVRLAVSAQSVFCGHILLEGG